MTTELEVMNSIPVQYQNKGPGYFVHLLVAIDEFFNVLLLNGMPHQTISQHSGLAARDGWWWARLLCWALGKIAKNHCENCIKGLV